MPMTVCHLLGAMREIPDTWTALIPHHASFWPVVRHAGRRYFLAECGSHVSLLRVGTWGRVLTRGPSFAHLTCLNLRVRVHQLFFAPRTVRRLPVPAGFLLSSSSRAPDPVEVACLRQNTMSKNRPASWRRMAWPGADECGVGRAAEKSLAARVPTLRSAVSALVFPAGPFSGSASSESSPIFPPLPWRLRMLCC